MAEANAVSSSDKMRKVVEQEGIEARNLLNWSVPVTEKGSLEGSRTAKKPPASPRPQSASPKPPSSQKDTESQFSFRASTRCQSLSRLKNRVRSASAGRNPEKDLRARYWAFLFENLYRAVDEIYQTCEMDESVVESKEAIMMLENYSKEFRALIQWLNISKNYENTEPPNRPTSLTWEVRKSLPSKGLLKTVFLDKLSSGNSSMKRPINVEIPSDAGLLSIAVQTESSYSSITAPLSTNKASTILPETQSVVLTDTVAKESLDKNRASDSNKSESEINVAIDQALCDNISGKNNITSLLSLDQKKEDNLIDMNTNVGKSEEASTYTSLSSVEPIIENFENVTKESEKRIEVIELNAPLINANEPVTGVASGSDTQVNDMKVRNEADSSANNVSKNITTGEIESLIKSNDLNAICHAKAESLVVDTAYAECASEKEIANLNITIVNEKNYCNTNSEVLNTIGHTNAPKSVIVYASVGSDSKREIIDHNVTVANNKNDICANNNCNAEGSVASNEVSEINEKSLPKSNQCHPFNNYDIPSRNKVAHGIVSETLSLLQKNESDMGESSNNKCRKSEVASSRKIEEINNLKNKFHQTTATVQKVGKATTVEKLCNASTATVRPKTYPSVTSNVLFKQQRPTEAKTIGSKSVKHAAMTRNATEVKKFGIHSAGNLSERKPFRTGNYEPNYRNFPGTAAFRKPFSKTTSVAGPNVMNPRLRPSQHHIGNHLRKDQPQTGSSSSLSSTSSCKSWADKVKGQDLLVDTGSDVTKSNSDDTDGWETVKSRTRCRNSPAKKLLPSNGASQAAVAAQISQNKMGGFPYTCTSNSQSLQKTQKLPVASIIAKTDDANSKLPPKSKDANLVKSQVFGGKTVKDRPSKTEVLKKGDLYMQPIDLSAKTVKQNSASKVKPLIKADSIQEEKNLDANKTNENQVSGHSSDLEQLSADDTQGNKKLNLKTTDSNSSLEVKEDQNSSTEEELLKPGKSNELKEPAIETNLISVKENTSNVQCSRAENFANSFSEPSSSQEKRDECPLDQKHSYDVRPIDPNSEIKNDVEEASRSTIDISNKSNAGLPDSVESGKSASFQELDVDESDIGLTSDDQDGALSQDEGDVQTLELYEKLMRDEAQEHVHQLGLSWGEQMDHLDMELRTPGRALQMHEKLSSPFRKRSLSETIRRHEERQLKAQEQRERLLEEKAQRFKDIQKKVEEMKVLKEKRQERQRIIMEQKLQRAEEKRKKALEKIIKKAHDEEEKVNEIAFINTLEAQNKRHDLISKEKDHEARLQDIQEERQRRLDEKAAKEAAAEERRKALEAERQARLMEMQEKRKQRDLKIEQQLIEKEKERLELANQKARDRELRREALNAAQQATLEVLQKKIQLKQEESARRHEENMEQIRIKAFELSVRRYSSYNDDAPQLVPYDTKKICTLCNVLIGSEVYLLSHLRGKKHQETVKDQHEGQDPPTEELELYNLKHIIDAPTDRLDPNLVLDKERQKALKKRCKKIRQRMTNRGVEYLTLIEGSTQPAISRRKAEMVKLISDIKKFLLIQDKRPWDVSSSSIFDKLMIDFEPLIDVCSVRDRIDLASLGCIPPIMEMIKIVSLPAANVNNTVPHKFVLKAFQLSQLIFEEIPPNCVYVMYTNKIGSILDVLSQRLNTLIPDNFSKLLLASSGAGVTTLPFDIVACELLNFLAVILSGLANKELLFNEEQTWITQETKLKLKEEFPHKLHDFISYVVSIGIVDRLSQYYTNVRGSIDDDRRLAHTLSYSLSFLTSLVKVFSDSRELVFEKKKTDDATQFIATLKVTDMISVVSLLYCILLHGGSPPLGASIPTQIPDHTLTVITAALTMLNEMAAMNIQVIQGMLGSEGLSLQLRHIASYLFWYCSHWVAYTILHEVILLIGYFAVLNPDNQLVIQAGQRPSVLQQLCSLPFCYFSDSNLTDILFPTLIACCFKSDCNKGILQQEMSCDLLSNYIEGQQLYISDAVLVSYKNKRGLPDPRWSLVARFPKSHWTAAKLYFSTFLE